MNCLSALLSNLLCSSVQPGLQRQVMMPCRCALQLLKDDPGELLRRLSIICLEDAILHPRLPVVVWLMVAHSKVRQGVRENTGWTGDNEQCLHQMDVHTVDVDHFG